MYENLKAEMVRKKLTMSELGAKCGISLTKLSSRMNGKTKFLFDETLEIREILDAERKIDMAVLFQKEVD